MLMTMAKTALLPPPDDAVGDVNPGVGDVGENVLQIGKRLFKQVGERKAAVDPVRDVQPLACLLQPLVDA
ncbi:MAG: hypothetical protein V8Q43_01795 [Christensenellaceae bacterium]